MACCIPFFSTPSCCERLTTLMMTSPSFRTNTCCCRLYDTFDNSIRTMIEINYQNAFRPVSNCCCCR